MKKKASQATVVTATITMLYLFNMAQLAIQWQLLQSRFVDSGETRKTIFITTYFNPEWATLASQGCTTAATNILADGLLVSTTCAFPFKFSQLNLGKIWRCFYAWPMGSVTSPHLLAIFFPCRRDRWDFIWENKELQLSKLIPSQRDIHELYYIFLSGQTNSIS